MKLIPILFKPEMAQATLKGLKTVTRRMNGLEDINVSPGIWEFVRMHNGVAKFWERNNAINEVYIKCPYGQPGNVLWVKETHFRFGFWDDLEGEFTKTGKQKKWFIPITDEVRYWENPPASVASKQPNNLSTPAWYKRPSLFMPYNSCRQVLKVRNVTLERIQDISPSDACDEGVEYWNIDWEAFEGGELLADYKNYAWIDDERYEDYHFPTFANPVDSFRTLWHSINGKESWDTNPWVWVVGFVKTSKPTMC